MKKALWDFSFDEMKEMTERFGEPKFRAKQLYTAVSMGVPLAEMTAIPKSLKEKIEAEYIPEAVKIIELLRAKDGTEKLLYRLHDGNVVEGVFMRYTYGNTLCVSTQVGCRMNCSFCASSLGGLVRNLTAGEMLGEVLTVNRKEGAGLKGARAVTNLVLMGSGEPLDNYDEVLKFIRLAASPDGLNISPRNVSLSTCGLVPEMLRLAEEGLPLNLTVSLHAADDENRTLLMPVNKSYPIKEVLRAAKHYFDVTKRRIHIEYSLIEGENCGEDSAKKLICLLKGLPCHVNLINLNPVKERGKRAAGRFSVERFRDILEQGGISVTIRRSMGAEIEGACGQLRNQFIEKTNTKQGFSDEQ